MGSFPDVPPTRTLAEQLAAKQREISVAEFFERNRQILGFDNPQRALLTTVKEAVDNALDGCEEAGVLPEIRAEIDRVDPDRVRVSIDDNGPGILRRELANVFGRLLYGSRFHVNRQSRGQQGIGISAAVLYAGLTSARPVKITSKVEEEEAAHVLELFIDTKKNLPKLVSEDLVLWDRSHGTKIELTLKGKYVRGRQSPLEYLRGTAIVNPHARIVLREPDGTKFTFERASTEIPQLPKEALPHPYGLEIGELRYLLSSTNRATILDWLTRDLQGVSSRAAREIAEAAALTTRSNPHSISSAGQERLLRALQGATLIAPDAESLSPIGTTLIKRGLRNVLGELRPEYFAPPVSRPPKVRGGFPFLVEVGLVYGGALPADQPMQVLRFANRVPLLFQQGACAITNSVASLDWRRYGLDQKGGSGLPVGPCLILVHLASTKIPFTSEAKEAIAEDDTIDRELVLALQTAARHLKTHLSRKSRREFASEKFAIIQRILPKLAAKTSGIVGKPVPDLTPVITRIMDVVNVETRATSGEAGPGLLVEIINYTPRPRVLEIFLELPPEQLVGITFTPVPQGLDPERGRAWWTMPKLASSERSQIRLDLPPKAEGDLGDVSWYVAGVDEAHLLGAEPLPGDWEVRLPKAVIEAAEASVDPNEDSEEQEVDYDAAEASAAKEDDE